MKYIIILILIISSCTNNYQKVEKAEEKIENGKTYYTIGKTYYTISDDYIVEETEINGHIYLVTHAYGPNITLTHAGHCPQTHN